MALTAADIKSVYLNVLQRGASDAEAQYWIDRASTLPLSDTQVRAAIFQSEEAQHFVDPIIRLYQTSFGRVPDKGGLSFFVHTLETGVTLQTAASFVASSQEFADRYNAGVHLSGDAVPSETIIQALYANVLGRSGSPAEVTWWLASGQSLSQVLTGFSESPEANARTAAPIDTFLAHVADSTASYTGDLFGTPTPTPTPTPIPTPTPTPTPPAGGGGPIAPLDQTFTLTVSADPISGGAGNDTISGTAATFGVADTINGGAGSDTLNITSAGLGAFTVPTVAVTNVETANITADNRVTADTRGWTGLTQLSVTDVGSATIDAASTTAVSETSTLGSGTITANGGANVSVTATGSTTGLIAIGGTTRPTGTITISNATVGAVNAGTITVAGGTKIDISQSAANAVNTTQTNGAVSVTGGTSTTEVKVVSTAAAVANVATAGVVASSVTISDIYSGSSTIAGSITKVTADGYSTLGINDNALKDLNVAHGAGNIIISNGGLIASTNTVLNMTMNAITGGTLADGGVYTNLNLTTNGTNSTLSNVAFSALTDLTVTGTKMLTLTSAAGMGSLQTVTVTGQAGLVANLSGASVQAVDTSGTTGASKFTIDPSRVSFTGGAGVDNISFTTQTTKTISGGGGIDTLTMSASLAATASLSSTFSGLVTEFEHLTLTGATNQAINLAAIGNYNHVTTSGGNGLTLNNLTSGGTLALTGSGTAYTLGSTNFSGASDLVNVSLTNGSGAGVSYTSSGLTANGVEEFHITNLDTTVSPAGNYNSSLRILGNSVEKIVIDGNSGLLLGAMSNSLKSVDASGITLGGFTFASGSAVSGAVTIKGSATGFNSIDFSASSSATLNYTGGSGNDIVVVGGGVNTITTGTGTDTIRFTAPAASVNSFSTITDAHAGDRIALAANGTEVFTSLAVTSPAIGATFRQHADAAIAALADGSTNGQLGWFQFSGDTYVVEAQTAAHTTFTDGTDYIVKLTGVIDLSTATISGHALLLN